MNSDNSENKRLFEEYRKELFERQRSNTKEYDKSILTLSVAFLGLSLAVIKDVVHIEGAKNVWCLYCSWILVCVAIVFAIVSFVVSQSAIEKQLDYAKHYYIDNRDEYIGKKSWQERVLKMLNRGSGVVFIAAVLLITYFVALNI